MDVLSQLVQSLAVYAIPVIFAITLHEAAHGYAAKVFGDSTAWMLGRVSLNPLRHVDPMGTIVVPVVMLIGSIMAGTSGMLFGWAKPVPVNFGALRKPKAHMFWVAAAGPLANLVQAVAWGAFYRVAAGWNEGFLLEVAKAGFIVNIGLMVINLLPVLPLDGGRIVFSILPNRLARPYGRLEPYGFPILLVLVFLHMQTGILDPLINGTGRAFLRLLGLGG